MYIYQIQAKCGFFLLHIRTVGSLNNLYFLSSDYRVKMPSIFTWSCAFSTFLPFLRISFLHYPICDTNRHLHVIVQLDFSVIDTKVATCMHFRQCLEATCISYSSLQRVMQYSCNTVDRRSLPVVKCTPLSHLYNISYVHHNTLVLRT